MEKIPGPPLTWVKSSASGGGNCVEVAASCEALHVRDSKIPAGSVLTFPAHSWQAFISGLR
ncbi:DUF397 domain-containing protein [Streptomyces fructofermentans]